LRYLHLIFLGVVLAACAQTPTPVPVTLTAPPRTPTPVPLDLSPSVEVGASFVYADGTTVVAVPAGRFVMGHGGAANPEHPVTLSDFWIYSTEVSNRQYSICVAQGRCTEPNSTDDPDYAVFASQNRPVSGVTYDQARDYCAFMDGDLPTEAQWEKAARGGDARPYPWGDNAPSCDLLNFNSCLKHTSDVTAAPKGKSAFGVLDMAGNVFEWVADWYDPLYYRTGPAGDPPGPASGRARVVRSSGYRSNADQSLSYARFYSSPGDHRGDLGFRCVVKDLGYFAPACRSASTIAAADMTSVTPDCPEISIEVQASACRYGGGAVVTFTDDHPQDPNASFGGIVGCTLLSGKPGSYPLSYQCRHSSMAVMSSSCTYAGIAGASCPAHYSLDVATGACQWDGTRTVGVDCPAGEFYDPVHHCCLTASGKLIDFPVCPVGTVFTETSSDAYACLPAESVRTAPSQTVPINPPDCPSICDLTAELCSLRNLVYCSTTCSCLSVGVKCPTH
jgi:formylglycine-generating enzyme required for sulfatase activity